MVAMRQARSSKGVARGPAEWGEVLFEPTWAKSRRFYDRGNLWMSICLLAMAVAMVFFLPISVPGFNAVDLMMIGIGTVVLLMGYSMLKQAATMMPFRIYSRGFTSVKVRLVQGLQRREELVGFDRLKTVRVKAFESPSYTLSVLQLVYVDEEGNEQVMNLDFEDPDTPLDVMMTFSTMVPEKTDKSVLSCLLPVVKESGSEVTQ